MCTWTTSTRKADSSSARFSAAAAAASAARSRLSCPSRASCGHSFRCFSACYDTACEMQLGRSWDAAAAMYDHECCRLWRRPELRGGGLDVPQTMMPDALPATGTLSTPSLSLLRPYELLEQTPGYLTDQRHGDLAFVGVWHGKRLVAVI